MNDDGIPRMDPRASAALATSRAGASHRLDEILRRAHTDLSPTTADKARGRAALGLPEPPAAPSAPAGWAALRASGKTGAVVSVVSLGLAFGGGVWLGRTAPGDPPSGVPAPAAMPAAAIGDPRTAPRPRALEPDAGARLDAGELAHMGRPTQESSGRATSPAHPAPAAHAGRGMRSARDVPHRSQPPPRSSAASDGVGSRRAGEELALMRRIERALRNDQPGLALALLAEAEARFPNSALEEERLAASVMAHCGLRDPGHERRAETFIESRPRSVYRTRVLAACEGARPDEGKARSGDE